MREGDEKRGSWALGVWIAAMVCSGCVINFKNPIPQQELIHVDAQYRYPGRNEFSSSDNFYKKEIDNGRFARTELTLDPGQQLLVMNKAIVLHFYQMPDTFYHAGRRDSASQFLRIWSDTLDKTIHGSGSVDIICSHRVTLLRN